MKMQPKRSKDCRGCINGLDEMHLIGETREEGASQAECLH